MTDSLELQADYWSKWNAEGREHTLSDVSTDQRAVAVEWLTNLRRKDLNIIDVGCGAGWLEPALAQFGQVTATDLCTSVLDRAHERMPQIRFVAGDFMTLDLGAGVYDAVVSLEVLSHVADQDAFVAKLASLLKPGGVLILATQNRPVLEQHNTIPAPQPGQLRRWVDRNELNALLSKYLTPQEIRTLTPVANKGLMRFVAGRKVKQVLRSIVGKGIEHQLAASGFGWTLMALAAKPAEH
ncbi:MAG: class I SAM-dependent methyltransferase [Hyphomonadaceae bacterium]